MTSVREMLERPLYRGQVVYSDLTLDAPHLRVVDEVLWQAVHARLERTRQTFTGHRRENGQLHGRPESGLVSRHLLAGFLRCGTCGGNLFPMVRTSARGKVRRYYACQAHCKQNGRRCSNGRLIPYEGITQAIRGHLDPKVLADATVALLHEIPCPDTTTQEATLRDLEARHARLLAAVEAGVARWRTL